MEIEELRRYWSLEDKRIAESVRVNRNVSHKKLRASFHRIKVKRLILLTLPCIYIPVIFASIAMKNDGTVGFYLSVLFFSAAVATAYAMNLYYYIRLSKIDYAEPVLQIQKEIVRLEIFDKRWHVIAYFIVPLVLAAALRMFGGPIISDRTTLLFCLFALVFLVVGYFVKVNKMLPGEYRKVKSYLDEMEEPDSAR